MDVIPPNLPKTLHETELRLWQAIEDLRVGRAVTEQKLDDNISYQKQRNNDILNAMAKIDARLQLDSEDTKAYRKAQDDKQHANIKKALGFLGALVVALIAYIWTSVVPHFPIR